MTNYHFFRKGWDKKISKYLRLTKEDKTITRWKQWQVEIREGGGKNFQLSVEEMSVQAGGNNWKGRAPSVLYRLSFDLLIGQGTTASILQFVFGQKNFSVAILDTKEGFEDNKNVFSS